MPDDIGLHRIDSSPTSPRWRNGRHRARRAIHGLELHRGCGWSGICCDRPGASAIASARAVGERNRRALAGSRPCPACRPPASAAWQAGRRRRGRRCPEDASPPQRPGAVARRCALVAGIRFHIGRIDLRIVGDAAGEGGELHRLQERDQLARVRLVHGEVVERHVELDLVVEQHQLPRDPCLLGVLDQRLAPLRLLDLAGAEQQLFRGRHIRRSAAPRS